MCNVDFNDSESVVTDMKALPTGPGTGQLLGLMQENEVLCGCLTPPISTLAFLNVPST